VMDFYIGNSIGAISSDDFNIEFRDDMSGFIYNMREQVNFDMSKLCEIAQMAISRDWGLVSIGDC